MLSQSRFISISNRPLVVWRFCVFLVWAFFSLFAISNHGGAMRAIAVLPRLQLQLPQ